MSYQVIARKWRPQKFSDVLDQEHITRTLQNAIIKDRVAHAYLFVGPRGIGKTTSARIFAKALNCTSPVSDTDESLEPCCKCQSCTEIANGNCLDVVEIDGASHNKVDDIRELRDHVQYTPTNGRKYKIYIIDEVHMLSQAAWNALLKTLEEPPPHIKFLFATTEAHKVLPTIVSRCQRFDLKRIAVPTIVRRLREIAEKEKIGVNEGALNVIARAADGGMRDAQSIFDQMISFCGHSEGDKDSTITESDVTDVFGLSSDTDLRALGNAIIGNDPNKVISIVHDLVNQGKNLERLYADLLLCFRNVMIFQTVDDPKKIIDLSDTEFDEYQCMAKASTPEVVGRVLEGLMSFESSIRSYLNKQVFIEVTFLRVMRDAHSVSLDAVIDQLRQRKGDISRNDNDTGTPPPLAEQAPSSSVDETPPPPDLAPVEGQSHPESDASAPLEPRTSQRASIEESSSIRHPQQNAPVTETPVSYHTTEEQFASQSDEHHGMREPTEMEIAPDTTTEIDAADLRSSLSINDQDNAPSIPEIDKKSSRESATTYWHILTEEVGKLPGRAALHMHMREAIPLSYDGQSLTIGISDEFSPEHARDFTNQDVIQTLTRCLSRITKHPEPKIEFQDVTENFSSSFNIETGKDLESNADIWEALAKNEFVKTVLKMFNGEIVDVRG